MEHLHLHLENCFGIHHLQQDFTFRNGKNTILIYAPNGTMKTSFAKTMLIYGNPMSKDQICDRLHPERKVICEIMDDHNDSIKPEDIFVINAENENYDASASCSSFLAREDLRVQYEKIHHKLDEAKKRLLTRLKKDSQSSDCELEIIKAFKIKDDSDFYDSLKQMMSLMGEDYSYPKYTFKYNNIFDKDDTTKQFLESNYVDLQIYLKRYDELLSQSTFFHKTSKGTFGTYQASELKKSVRDGSFFGVKHTILLADGTRIAANDALIQKIEEEKNKIFSDVKLRNEFDKITDLIDANTSKRELKETLLANPTLMLELADYDKFRQRYWLGYLASEAYIQEAKELVELYDNTQKELKDIIDEANKENETWKKIVDLYKSRFDVPFKVWVGNSKDIILKKNTPQLNFAYTNEGQDILQSKDELQKILSKGEKRAMFILQMLFEIEERRARESDQLLVIDDIADSFDYQNKYAIIEYLKDLHTDDSSHFKMVVLTHNFDFFRVVFNRFQNIKGNSFYAERDESANISLVDRGLYRTPYEMFCTHNQDARCYISLIPFVRNLIEYSSGENDDYIKLTHCLHFKSNIVTITDTDIKPILNKYIKGTQISYKEQGISIFDLISSEADKICSQGMVTELVLQDKIVLSIAIRLLAERYMSDVLLAHGVLQQKELDDMNRCPESTMLKKCRDLLSVNLDILERVNMMTPENIHINSFMYEPILDMSVHHLVQLYKDCKEKLRRFE